MGPADLIIEWSLWVAIGASLSLATVAWVGRLLRK